MANNSKQCFNTHYQSHCHPTTKSLWLCSSVYCRPPHQSRRIWLVAAATNQKQEKRNRKSEKKVTGKSVTGKKVIVVTIRTEVIFLANKCNIFVRHTEVNFHANNMIYCFFPHGSSASVRIYCFWRLSTRKFENIRLWDYTPEIGICAVYKIQYRVMFVKNWRENS